MTLKKFSFFFLFSLALASCSSYVAPVPPKGSFGYDLNFLIKKDSTMVILIGDNPNAEVLVSPKYQGKVFTSTAEGDFGKSLGWVNYKEFAMTKHDPHMNPYGGEDRLWLGPEGGKFSLFFKPGTAQVIDNWHTPAPFDTEGWQLDTSSSKMAQLSKLVILQNYAGTQLKISLSRSIKIIEGIDITKMLGVIPGGSVNSVAFCTSNTIINVGNTAWTKETGAPCLWNLDMFTPSPSTVIVIPYRDTTGTIATTDYFGQIPPDRVKFDNGTLYFKADGKSRGKLGVPPLRVKNFAGSYDAVNNVLTIITYDYDSKATYLNQEWKTDKNPLIGDAVNAYNDGPLPNGTQMGPFYEMESVSPAAFLKPNERLTHTHCVFHFTGNKSELNDIALKTLGVSLDNIKLAF